MRCAARGCGRVCATRSTGHFARSSAACLVPHGPPCTPQGGPPTESERTCAAAVGAAAIDTAAGGGERRLRATGSAAAAAGPAHERCGHDVRGVPAGVHGRGDVSAAADRVPSRHACGAAPPTCAMPRAAPAVQKRSRAYIMGAERAARVCTSTRATMCLNQLLLRPFAGVGTSQQARFAGHAHAHSSR